MNAGPDDCLAYDAAAVFYDLDYQERPDVDFWAERIPRWGQTILEIGCGTGRILEALMERDTTRELVLHGLDVSPAMIAAARQRTGLQTLSVGDMRDFSGSYRLRFDCVVIPFNSIMHLERSEDWERVFREVRTVLNPGGVCALSLLNPSGEDWEDDDGWWEVKDLSVCADEAGRVRDAAAGEAGTCVPVVYRKWCRKQRAAVGGSVLDLWFAFLPEWEEPLPAEPMGTRTGEDGLPRVCFRFPLRYAYPSEVLAHMDRAGLEPIDVWGDWTERSAREDSESFVIVARRSP